SRGRTDGARRFVIKEANQLLGQGRRPDLQHHALRGQQRICSAHSNLRAGHRVEAIHLQNRTIRRLRLPRSRRAFHRRRFARRKFRRANRRCQVPIDKIKWTSKIWSKFSPSLPKMARRYASCWLTETRPSAIKASPKPGSQPAQARRSII